MKKLSTFILLLFCAAGTMQAQSFAFQKNGEELPDNASYTASEVETFPLLVIVSGLELVNKTSGTLQIEVTQTVLQAPIAANSWLSICFDQCFVTNESKTIQGELPVRGNTGLHVYLNPMAGVPETVIVKYEVTNLANPSEKKTVTVTYLYGTVGIENGKKTTDIEFFGKSFKYDFASLADRSLQIFDLTGKCVSDIKLKRISDTVVLEFQKGIYLYRLSENGKTIKNSKFTIK
jgi:hypothetical protein